MSSDVTARGRTSGPAGLIAAGVVAVALLASYAPNVLNLAQLWLSEPNYSHGLLVAPIALGILWQRRAKLERNAPRPNGLGWALLLGALAARAWFFERNDQWLENATLLPALAALALAFGGWPLLKWAWPSIAFLVFMLPLPPRLNLILAGPLQRLATLGSTALLQGMGLPVLAQGNVILVGSERLEVAQACNGLSMLLSFVTLITAMVILLAGRRPLWERLVLLASAVPIALISNVLRIAATAWAYHWLGAERGERIAHDLAGWAMMPIALVLFLAEMALLSWLVVEEDPGTVRRLVLAPSSYAPPPPRPATGS